MFKRNNWALVLDKLKAVVTLKKNTCTVPLNKVVKKLVIYTHTRFKTDSWKHWFCISKTPSLVKLDLHMVTKALKNLSEWRKKIVQTWRWINRKYRLTLCIPYRKISFKSLCKLNIPPVMLVALTRCDRDERLIKENNNIAWNLESNVFNSKMQYMPKKSRLIGFSSHAACTYTCRC